jgi:two-component system sensor histidine kinase AlgZ
MAGSYASRWTTRSPRRGAHHAGNRMALDNIRERLMLFHDLEARLEIDEADGRYRVRIRLPWETEAA